MFYKSGVVFALMAVAKLAVATPPACILGAIGSQPDPTDFKTLCSGKVATGIQAYLSSNCGGQVSAAQGAFSDTCKQAGLTVASVSVSATPSSSTPSGTPKSTAPATKTASSAASNASASASTAKSTGAAVLGRRADGAIVGGALALAGLFVAI